MYTDVSGEPNNANIDSTCKALIATVQKASADVTAFVRRCRPARADLAPTTRELSELQMVLELLSDHESQEQGKRAIPEELQTPLRPILANCTTTFLRIDDILRQHGSEAGDGILKWTAQSRDEVRELETVLGLYRNVLGLVSDLVSILASSGTVETSGASSAGGMTPNGLRMPDVLQELYASRTSALASQSTSMLARQNLALRIHLDHIISYVETVARSKDWEGAVKALNDAQRSTACATTEKEDVRGSIPVTAPLRRMSSTRDAGIAGDNFIVLNRGFENLLLREDRSVSTNWLFASHGNQEPGPLMAGGPSTGMMIMDGAGLPGMSGTNAPLQPILRSNSSSANPRKHLGRRTLGQQQHAMIYTTEKEVAYPMGGQEEITEEALAFAQVPVHILGRLSFNLVGHVYAGTTSPGPNDANSPGNVSGSPHPTNYNHSLLTTKTDEGCFDNASARTSDAGSLHDGDLQFSQLDPLKPPVAAITQPLPPSQTTLASQTSWESHMSVSHQQQQQQPHQFYQQPILPPQQSLPPLPLPPQPFSQPGQPPLPPAQSAAAIPQHHTSAYLVSNAQPPPPPSSSQQQQQQQQQHPPQTIQQQQHALYYPHQGSVPSSSAHHSPVYGPQPPPPSTSGQIHGLREMRSISTMNTQTFINMQKPLPRTPLVYVPSYPGPFLKTKAVVVGNFSCGKTCLITRMSRGHYPRIKQDKCSITETVRVAIDEEPIELSLWDIRGIDYDPTWLKGAHVALICFSVNIGSTDSKGKHLGRWVAEINRNCPGASILLVGTKTDIRFHTRSVEKLHARGKGLVTPQQGAMFRDNIGASQYLECSARTGDGVLEVLGETARVAMQVKRAQYARKNGGGEGLARRPLSRIGRFLGISR